MMAPLKAKVSKSQPHHTPDCVEQYLTFSLRFHSGFGSWEAYSCVVRGERCHRTAIAAPDPTIERTIGRNARWIREIAPHTRKYVGYSGDVGQSQRCRHRLRSVQCIRHNHHRKLQRNIFTKITHETEETKCSDARNSRPTAEYLQIVPESQVEKMIRRPGFGWNCSATFDWTNNQSGVSSLYSYIALLLFIDITVYI